MVNPQNILLTGESGVGKTTILNLFPGDIVLELDDNFNEIFQKSVELGKSKDTQEYIVREIDLRDLVKDFIAYKKILDLIDTIFVIVDSTEDNIKSTKELLSRLKDKLIHSNFYIIANFQDRKSISLDLDKISSIMKYKVYDFSAIQKDSRDKLFSIINDTMVFTLQNKDRTSEVVSQIKDPDLFWTQIDQAIDLDMKQDFLSSANYFSSIASNLVDFNLNVEEFDTNVLHHLLKAWEYIELSINEKNTLKLTDAIDLLKITYEEVFEDDLKQLILANSKFCQALIIGIDFDKSSELDKREKYLPEIKKIFREIIEIYREAKYRREEEWTQDTLNALDKI